MQENIKQPTSLSQHLRESYLAEAREHQRHSEMSRLDSSSPRHLLYGTLKGQVDESGLPDLSAFLNQEELHKSVNLACQAIGHKPREDKVEVRAHIAPAAPDPSTQTASEKQMFPPLAPDRQALDTAVQESVPRNNGMPRERPSDFKKASRTREAPYGVETQSKKEFLNKAADFIEELSSLFKANSSKRIRPRSCKSHRSRHQGKAQADGAAFPPGLDDRERSVVALAEVHTEENPEDTEFSSQESGIPEELGDCAAPEEEEQEEPVSVEPSYPDEPPCEPPCFVQKLKSREVPEGSKVQLDCIVRGLPVPEVRWFCEGKELENCPDIQILTDGELHSLIIAEAFEEDTGRYSCFASNFYGTDSTSAEIYIEGASSSDSEGEQHFEHVAQPQMRNAPAAPALPSVSSTSDKNTHVDIEAGLQPETSTPLLLKEASPLLPSPAVTSSVSDLVTTACVSALDTVIPPPPPVVSSLLPAHKILTHSPTQRVPTVPAVEIPPTLSSTQTVPAVPSTEVGLTLPPITVIPTLPPAKGVQPLASVPVASTLPFVELIPAVSSIPAVPTPPPVEVYPTLPSVPAVPTPPLVEVYPTLPSVPAVHTLPPVEVYPTLPSVPAVPTLPPVEVYPTLPSFPAVPSPPAAQIIASLAAKGVSPQPSATGVTAPLAAHRSSASSPSQTFSTVLSTQVVTSDLVLPETHYSSSYPQGLDGRPLMAAPVFTKSLQDLLSLEGQLVVLECRVKGVPSPKVDWYREGTIIEDSPDFRILQKKPRSMSESEEICTLVIAEVFPEDSGTFTCTASNKYGTVSSIAALKVKGNDSSQVKTLPCLKVESPQPTGSELLSADPFVSRLKPPPEASLTNSGKPHSTKRQESRSFSLSTVRTVGPLTKALNHGPEALSAVPVPDPPGSCLKPKLEGVLVNHKEPRSSSRVGLRVHFKLPEEVERDASGNQSEEYMAQALSNKEPPPVLAKPKLDHVQLQILHNQVLLEQQQEDPPESLEDACLWSAKPRQEPPPGLIRPLQSNRQSPLASTPTAVMSPAPKPLLNTALRPIVSTAYMPVSSTVSTPILSTASGPTLNIPLPLSTVQGTQLYNSKTSHLGQALSPMQNSPHLPQFNIAPSPHFNTSPPVLLNASHASAPSKAATPHLKAAQPPLPNTVPMSQSFSYTRPKEFIAAQTLSPIHSPSPMDSPVPMLHEIALLVSPKPATEPSPSPFNQFSPHPRVFPTRVLKSPTSPPMSVSSPTLVPPAFLNSVFALRSQSPPQAPSPTSSCSSPSPIQNPVAFLSSVLPSLPSLPPSLHTNAMGLPKSAPHMPPQGTQRKLPRAPRSLSHGDVSESKEILLHDIEKKLWFKEESNPNEQQEYKVSNFEQRLMSEIEFRLERTPVEESDDDVHHDAIPTGKCIAPVFDKKLKNYRAMEGVPMTFTCKVVGIPVPKVYWFKDGKQILRKNVHYKKIREGDGICSLYIESTTNDDDGNYTVMAANPQGRISCSGHLIVQTGPIRSRQSMIHSQRVRARVQEVEEGEPTQERFFRPHFLQAPGDMVAHEGRLCRLDCKVSGLPHPELMWLLNGRPIYPDFYHRMLVRENGIHSLIIDPLTQSDAGTYTCIASNKAGQSSFCLELRVVEKEVKQAPQLIEKLQNTGIAEGSPVRLECRVVGMPPPAIFWKKDNDSISAKKERVSMHQDATGYVCLTIQPARKEDAGWYTVSAKNEAGIVSCTSRLDIYAQWHQQIPVPMKKAPRSGSRYAALTGQGLDIKSAFPTGDNGPILFSSSPVEVALESEEL